MAAASEFGQPIPGYKILEHLGAGATSSVYRARQLSLDRDVALKVIRKDRLEKDVSVQRVMKEARLLGQLDHPGIVRSVDFGEAGNLMYFAMEYVPGRSATAFLQEKERLGVREAVFITACIARALQYAAERGITHRDVKPGNILLGRDGAVKLTDFGLARMAKDRSLTRHGATVGTPQYMSPEQVRHARRVDLRSDLYSLGATLYHLVTGTAPYSGENVAEILHQVLYGRPTPPEKLVPDLPPALSRIIARLMARDPARRYQDAAGLLADLERVEDPAGEGAVGLSWQEAAQAPVPRRRRMLLGAAGAALVLAGAALTLLVLDLRGDGEEQRLLGEERQLLGDLESQVEDGGVPPLAALATLTNWSRDGRVTARSRAEQKALERAVLQGLDEQLAELERQVWSGVAAAAGSGRWAGGREELEADLERGLAELRSGVVPPPDAVALLEQRGGEMHRRLVERWEKFRLAAVRAIQERLTALQAETEEALSEGETALLARHEYDAARALLEAYEEKRDRAVIGGYAAALRDSLIPREEVLDPAGLWAGLPEPLRREAGVSFAVGLRARVEQHLSRYQDEICTRIAEAARRDVQRIEAGTGERGRGAAQWVEAVREELAGSGVDWDELPREPRDTARCLSEYESAVREALQHAGEVRRERALATLLEGSPEDPGLFSLLESHRVAAALERLEGARGQGIDTTVEAWAGPLRRIQTVLSRARDRLHLAADTSVELRDRGGILLKGILSDEPGTGTFRVGSHGGVRLEDLSYRTVLSLGGTDVLDDEARGLFLEIWGSKGDQDELVALLEHLPATDPVEWIRARRREESARVEGERRDLEQEAEDEWQALQEALAESRFDDAEGALRRLQSPRLLGTATVRAQRSTFPALEDALRSGRSRALLGDAVRRLYPHASRAEPLENGAVRVVYDFQDVEQARDFELGAGVEVDDQALRFDAAVMGDRGRSALWGPSLALPVDRSRPFRLRLEIAAPMESAAPPHLVAFQAAGFCVAFFRPTAPRNVHYPPQLNVWEGPLDQYRDHFFDPALGESEPRRGRSVVVGLERGVLHTVELRYEPREQKGLALLVDGMPAATLSSSATAPSSERFEFRTVSSLAVHSLDFEGVLRIP